MTIPKTTRSDWLTWMVAAIAIIAIATAAGLGVLYAKEAHDTSCARSAANRDRAALVQLEMSQRDRLEHPSVQSIAGVVLAINNYLATVKADDPVRESC